MLKSMINSESIQWFQSSVQKELNENILPFWLKHSVDPVHGGFIGRMFNNLKLEPNAPKGLILNARILWTFSTLYRLEAKPEYQEMAERAFDYLVRHFHDDVHGGFYWTVDQAGNPLDTAKKTYGQAFMVYAFSEFADAFGRNESLDAAMSLFKLIETKCKDAQYEGYFETFTREWDIAKDLRLSDKDMDEKKSMNTHLHVLEAYSNLYRITGNRDVRTALENMIHVFQNRIINPEKHCFYLFFDETWSVKTDRISFGHDIEGSWLIWEAAEILNDSNILDHLREVVIQMAREVKNHGLDEDGGIFYEGSPSGITESNKDWWPQAEAAVGFLNACLLSGSEDFYHCAQKSWQFILDNISDARHGEWIWGVSKNRIPNEKEYKICEWKGPYHNVRACLEILKRIEQLKAIIDE